MAVVGCLGDFVSRPLFKYLPTRRDYTSCRCACEPRGMVAPSRFRLDNTGAAVWLGCAYYGCDSRKYRTGVQERHLFPPEFMISDGRLCADGVLSLVRIGMVSLSAIEVIPWFNNFEPNRISEE